MQVIAVQPDIAWEDPDANFRQVDDLLSAADVAKGALIVLPEMFATGFSMDVERIAEPADGPIARYVGQLAKRLRCTVVAGLVTTAPDGRGLNQAMIVAPDTNAGHDSREIARYTKFHPFSFAGEDQHYAPGEQIVLFPCGGFTAAVQICYDLRFPELYRQAALSGADLMVTLANFPLAREAHWLALSVARAIENQAFVVACNRCGSDPKNKYGGRSLVIDPLGRILADAGDQPGVASATIEPAQAAEYRQRFPALADVRPSLMGKRGQ